MKSQSHASTFFDLITSELADNILIVLVALGVAIWFTAQWVAKVNLFRKDQRQAVSVLKDILK